MNGSESKIEIFKPFGDAFELMKKILFRPFDFQKWLTIGFAAFLAGHFAGVGFNFPGRWGNFRGNAAERNFVGAGMEQWKPWLAIAIGVGVLFFIVLILVLTWLKARGSFIFTDCIVRNRAAIAAPWREYRKEGNSYFLFLLAVTFGTIALVAVFAVVIVVPLVWSGYQPHGATSVAFIIGGLLVFIAYMLFAIAFALISYFMVPIMYVRRCRALDAFRETAGLIVNNLGSFVLFVLFGIVLFLALIIIGTILTCATCCMASLPYIGTVILLPAFVWLRAFGLLFIRQFGPDYDVWQGTESLSVVSNTTPPFPPPIQT